MQPTFKHLQLVLANILIFSLSLSAQIEVTDGATIPYTPENLITNVLLGDGVEVTNFLYDGDPKSVGFFKDAEDELGFDRGVIMSTGHVSTGGGSVGADAPGSDQASSAVFPDITEDADLTSLDPDLVNRNITRYIITFIPTTDQLNFNYVFASEEYPEFACSTFNDLFGFFISGPGINGTFENNAVNIALVPGTTDFVSIENIHFQNGPACPAVHADLLNDNLGSNTHPVYDAYTDVFQASVTVTPCEEYTIKLVISDKGDEVFDSAVFLEAKSFGTSALDVDIVTVSLDGGVIEGCSDGEIVISVPEPVEADTPVEITISGEAEEGVDYEDIPDNIFIAQGDSVVTIPIVAIIDNIEEGSEEIEITVQIDNCNLETYYININDPRLIDPDLGADIQQCQADSVQLDGTLDIPLPVPSTFTNEDDFIIAPINTAINSPIGVSGVQPLILQPGVIQSVCIDITHSWIDDLDIFLVSPSGQFIELVTDIGQNCDDFPQTCFSPTATTQWTDIIPLGYNCSSGESSNLTGQDFQIEGEWSDLYFGEPLTNGEWQLLLSDDGPGQPGTVNSWSITFNPVYQIFYEWAPAAGLSCTDCPNPTANPQETTTYTLRVFDSYGCETFDEITIEIEESSEATVVTCQGANQGCISFSWEDNGSISYEVNINNGGWVAIPDGVFQYTECGFLPNQEIEVQVQGIADCVSFIGTEICTTSPCTQPTVENVIMTPSLCSDSEDGSLSFTITSGQMPYTVITNGQTMVTNDIVTFEGLPSGANEITITDAVQCEIIVTLNVGSAEAITAIFSDQQNISCMGANNGSVTLTPMGGMGPYNIVWSNGETGPNPMNLVPGVNNVVVTDANDCAFNSSITILEPTQIEITNVNPVHIACFGANTGSIFVQASGGTGELQYSWNDANNQPTAEATELVAGDYILTITDENNCSISSQIITLTESTEIELEESSDFASCDGGIDGTATVNPSGGGIDFYVFSWDENANSQTTQTATGLAAGVYSVTVTNAFDCSVETTVEVLSPTTLTAEIVTLPTSCFDSEDGSATLIVQGGVEPYSYIWANGVTTSTPENHQLQSGSQSVLVSDANNCTTPIAFDIDTPDEITAAINIVNQVSCFGGANATIEVTAQGGVGSYSYQWDDDNTQNTAIASGLPIGTYCVVVTDQNDCETQLCEDVTQPTEIIVEEDITNPSCFGFNNGSIEINVSGGVGDYTFQWSDGQDQNIATGLSQGTISIVVTDLNNCSTPSIEFAVDEPTELTSTTQTTALSCESTNDGTATINPSGGTMPYSFLWENGQTTQTASNLEAQSYNVSVSDNQGCETTNQVILTQPVDITIDNISSTMVSCFAGTNGTATVDYSGGTAPFMVTWSNGDEGDTVDELPAGIYNVIITDQSDCIAESQIMVEQPEDLVITLDQNAPLCHGGSNGTAIVTSLAYGTTLADVSDFNIVWSNTDHGPESSNLTGGQTYTVSITDLLDCNWEDEITIENPNEILSQLANSSDVSCFGLSDGQATLTSLGATPPFQYLWPTSAGDQDTDNIGENLAAGIYIVSVTDANECPAEVEISINQPEILQASLNSETASCPGYDDGQASVEVVGGTNPYQYSWSNDVNDSTNENIIAGTYSVTVIDNNDCEVIAEIRVEEPESVVTNLNDSEDPSCFGTSDGLIDLQSVGGSTPYTYSIDGGETFINSSTFIGLEAGSYNFIIKDSRECLSYLNNIEIDQPKLLSVDLGENIEIEFGELATLSSIVEGGSGDYSYSWQPIGPGDLSCYDCPSTLVDTLYDQAGFWLTVIDENGCFARDEITVFIKQDIKILVPTAFTPNGDNVNDLLLVHGSNNVTVNQLTIFDRWGEAVYHLEEFPTNQKEEGWDGKFRGKEVPGGVYVWYINATSERGDEVNIKGSTTLIR